MWRALFVEQIPVTEKILRTVLVYALIAILFRVAGKRGLEVTARLSRIEELLGALS
jgi:hypothetical protein